MAWGVGASIGWGAGEFVGAVAANNAPVVTAPADITLEFANGGAGLLKTNANLVAWSVSGTGTDAEDGAVTVTADLSGLASIIPVGVYTITFRATDSGGLIGTATAVLTVQEAVAVNAPPVSSGNYASQSATVGVPFAFAAGANISDPGDTLTFSSSNLPAWASIDPVTGDISGTPSVAGGVTILIDATDTVGQSLPVPVQLPVVVSAAIDTPAFAATAPRGRVLRFA